MFSHLGARRAAVAPARGRLVQFNVVSRMAAATVAAVSLAGCMSDERPVALAGDPANPAAGRAGVGYRSTIAPYTSLRPSTPAPWRERNDSVTPPAKSDR
jgi:hypothetical protein